MRNKHPHDPLFGAAESNFVNFNLAPALGIIAGVKYDSAAADLLGKKHCRC